MKTPPSILDLRESLRPQMEEVDWIIKHPDSHITALRVREGLGTLPRRLNKTYVQFDFEEERTYGGLPGSKLAGLAAKIVLTARDETRLLRTIRGMVFGLLGPLVAYLRVNLALTWLEEVMAQSYHSGLAPEGQEVGGRLPMNARPSGSTASLAAGMTDIAFTPTLHPMPVAEPGEIDMPLTCYPGPDPRDREIVDNSISSLEVPDKPLVFRDDTAAKPRPTFRWRESPASVYKFKEQTEKLGYDPRETSAYWIETRANALRRQWRAQTKSEALKPCPPHLPKPDMQIEITPPRAADIPLREFVPADADYGTIWPPLALPDGPPKPARQSMGAKQVSVKARALEPGLIHDVAPAKGGYGTSSQAAAIEGRVLGLGEQPLTVADPRGMRINQDDICGRADGNAAGWKSEQIGGITGQSFEKHHQIQALIRDLGQSGSEQDFQTHRAGRGLGEGQAFVSGGPRVVGRDNHIDRPVIDPAQQSTPVTLSPQGRVELGEGAVIADVNLVQSQMINRDRAGNVEVAGFRGADHIDGPLAGNQIDQQAPAGQLRERNIALSHDNLGGGGNAGQSKAGGKVALMRAGSGGQGGVFGAVGDQSIKCGRIRQKTAHDQAVGDRFWPA